MANQSPGQHLTRTVGSRISVAIDAGVADVRLIRMEKRNAMDGEMMAALVTVGEELGGMNTVRAVVLSGEGSAFCAGIDLQFLKVFQNPEALERLAERNYGDMNLVQRAVLTWHDCPVPVIAAVHGFAFGAGFQLALGADMRYVEPDTQLSVMEIRWGLVPDMAGTLLMRGLARDDVVRELCFTGRIFSGREALDLGFATRTCADPRADAFATAREIAGKSPDAVRAIKHLLREAATNGRREQLLAETLQQIRLLEGHNHAEAVAAGRAKRDAVFADSTLGRDKADNP